MGVLIHAGGDLGPLGYTVASNYNTWVRKAGDFGEVSAAIGNGFFGWEVVNFASWQGNLVTLNGSTVKVYFGGRFDIRSWAAGSAEWSLFVTERSSVGNPPTYAVGLTASGDDVFWRLWKISGGWATPTYTQLETGSTNVTVVSPHRFDIEVDIDPASDTYQQIKLWHDGILQFTHLDTGVSVNQAISLWQHEIVAGKSGQDLTMRYDHWIVNEDGGPAPTGRLDNTYEVFGHRQHGADAIGGFADMNGAGAAALQPGGVTLLKAATGGTYKWCATDGVTPRSKEESIAYSRFLSQCLDDVGGGGIPWTEQLFNSCQVTGIGSGDRILEVVIKDGTNPTAAEAADTVSICPVVTAVGRSQVVMV